MNMKLALESPGSMIMHKDQNETRKAKSVQKDNIGAHAVNNPPQLFKKETVDLEKIFLEEKQEFVKLHERVAADGRVMKQSGKESSIQVALNPQVDRSDTADSGKKQSKQQDDSSPRFMIDGG